MKGLDKKQLKAIKGGFGLVDDYTGDVQVERVVPIQTVSIAAKDVPVF